MIIIFMQSSDQKTFPDRYRVTSGEIIAMRESFQPGYSPSSDVDNEIQNRRKLIYSGC